LAGQNGSSALRVQLALALGMYADLLQHLARPAESEAPLREVVDIRRSLAHEASNPETEKALAGALHGHAGILAALGRSQEALPVRKEVVSIVRRLVEQEGRVDFTDELTRATSSYSETLATLNQQDQIIRDVATDLDAVRKGQLDRAGPLTGE